MPQILVALRPWQWLKNTLVFAALIFARRADDPSALLAASLAFVSLCLVSSAVYLVNDLLDLRHDRAHPSKRRRPIAAGTVSPGTASTLAVLLAAAGLWTGAAIEPAPGPWPTSFAPVPAVYLALGVLYSLALKRVFLVDVLTITQLFLLRVVGGGIAIGVEVSSWLLVSTFFLALFLGLGKRRGEVARMGEGTVASRPVLASYSPEVLNVLLSAAAAALLVTYVLYTVSDRTIALYGTRNLFFTTPFAVYGVGRYLSLTMVPERAEDPSLVFLADRPLQVATLGWLAAVFAVLYA